MRECLGSTPSRPTPKNTEEQMSLLDELAALIEMLAEHEDDCEKIDARGYGWKTANRNLRKTTLALEKRLKALRKASINLEK